MDLEIFLNRSNGQYLFDVTYDLDKDPKVNKTFWIEGEDFRGMEEMLTSEVVNIEFTSQDHFETWLFSEAEVQRIKQEERNELYL